MPVEMERKLRSEARRKGMSGKEADAFVFGTMRKQGWKPSTQKKKGTGKSKTTHGF